MGGVVFITNLIITITTTTIIITIKWALMNSIEHTRESEVWEINGQIVESTREACFLLRDLLKLTFFRVHSYVSPA